MSFKVGNVFKNKVTPRTANNIKKVSQRLAVMITGKDFFTLLWFAP